MIKRAKKITLSAFVQTEVTTEDADRASRVQLANGSEYFITPVEQPDFEYDEVLGAIQVALPVRFNLYPVVMDSENVPWAEANIFLLSKIKNSLKVVMSTYASLASDLVAYRQFLDESQINWIDFPKNKLNRPTYRYRAYLKMLIETDEVTVTTSRRRMGSIIAFYRWLHAEGVLIPEFPMWKESDHYIELKNQYGGHYSKHVKSTDISIKSSNSNNPYADEIDDGGQLRPLSIKEQKWVLEALLSLANTEMTLIHLCSLLTGARIQTILTFRLHHVFTEIDNPNLFEVRIPVGPKTGIDTKNDKKIVLHLPLWFYQKLHTYALSQRAQKRRQKAVNGDSEDQYLFLSTRGAPFYQSKEDLHRFNKDFSLHHAKTGQAVRQFITEKVVPFIRQRFDAPNFNYKFHDLRASYGMNLTDAQLELVSHGERSLHEAREFVKSRMCHESSATTDLYLQYRSNLKLVRSIATEYDQHLVRLAQTELEVDRS